LIRLGRALTAHAFSHISRISRILPAPKRVKGPSSCDSDSSSRTEGGSKTRADGKAPMLRNGVTDAHFTEARQWLEALKEDDK
jgi:hypothetical protein